MYFDWRHGSGTMNHSPAEPSSRKFREPVSCESPEAVEWLGVTEQSGKPHKGSEPIPWLGAQLKRWRKNAGFTQAHVVRETGLSKSMVSQMESGATTPSIQTLIDYCDAIQTSPGRILRGKSSGKDAEFIRIAEALRNTIGLKGMEWMASLEPDVAKIAIQRAREAAAYALISERAATGTPDTQEPERPARKREKTRPNKRPA